MALLGLSLLLCLGGASLSVSAYHIDGAEPGGTAPRELSSNDFVTTGLGGVLIACEREYGTGFPFPGGPLPADDRNDNPARAAAGTHFGQGGLCTTGENDATGRLPLGQTFLSQAVAPGGPATSADGFVRLDACSVPTHRRNPGWGHGPYNQEGQAPAGLCESAFGSTGEHAWTFELGAYSCFIPVTGSPGTAPAMDSNYAAYYDRLYAFFLYDGDGTYTTGDVRGAPHRADTPNVQDPVGLDNVDAFHGHASMFIDVAASVPAAPPNGSAEAFPASFGQGNDAGAGVVWRVAMNAGVGHDSSCGGSQGFTVGGVAGGATSTYGCATGQACGRHPLGPVFRACYMASAAGPGCGDGNCPYPAAANSDADALTDCQELDLLTNPAAADTDGDALDDWLESNQNAGRDNLFCGAPCPAGHVPNPLRPDLYVEVDWMVNGTTSYKPTTAQIAKVEAAFAAQGIRAHFDLGALGGGNQVPFTAVLRFAQVNAGQVDFQDYKHGGDGVARQFAAARVGVFRYLIVGERYAESPNSSGAAWGLDDDVFVAGAVLPLLGGTAGLDVAVAGTIIHELGHTLCLVHDALISPDIPAASPCRFDEIDTQGNATYESSMNYRYQAEMVDYSHGPNVMLALKDHDDWSAIRFDGIAAANNQEPPHGRAPTSDELDAIREAMIIEPAVPAFPLD